MSRSISLAVMVSLIAIAGVTAGTSTAQAASRSCTGITLFEVGDYSQYLPTVGYGTGDLDCVLGFGNDSDAVYMLQVTLDGCYKAGLKQDGNYGTLTEAAVRNVQHAVGVPRDGVYGPQRSEGR